MLAQGCVICAIGCISLVLILVSLAGGFSAVHFGVGALLMIFVIRFLITVIEDFFVVMDQQGVEQLRVVHGRRFFVKKRLAWGNVDTVTQRNLLYRLGGSDFEVRLNISSFNDGNEFLEFLEAHLPGDLTR